MSEPQTLFAINAVIVWLIQKVKLVRWFPWITTETQKINRIVSAIAATLASAGMTFSFTNPEHGTYVLSVVGLTLTHVVNFGVTAIVNYFTQKLVFKVAYSNGNGKN